MENTYLDQLLLLAKGRSLPHAIIIQSKNSEFIKDYLKEFLANAMCASKDGKPCKKCSDCIKIEAESHPDVKFIEPEKDAGPIKIEHIRDIREDAHIISNEGGYKFYIITNGERLTVQAQNAFIKILEEPPKNVIFIICTEFLSSLISTVRSRCQVFKCLEIENLSDSAENLAKEFVEAILNKDKIKMLFLGGEISNDRIFFKQIVNKIIELLIKSSGKAVLKINLIEKLDVLKSLIEMAERNVNFNLLVCALCAKM